MMNYLFIIAVFIINESVLSQIIDKDTSDVIIRRTKRIFLQNITSVM